MPENTTTPTPVSTVWSANESILADAARLDLIAGSTTEPTEYGTALSVFVPPGYRHELLDVDRFNPKPSRRKRNVTLTRTSALVGYMRRHVDNALDGGPDDTTLYVDPDIPGVVAILDDTAGWRDDKATLRWQPTDGWLRWIEASGKMLDQDAFANLIEDGLTEIAKPAGADLLELAQSIHATTDARFSSDRRLVSGQVQLSYVENVNATAGADGKMLIPNEIVLVLAPFEGAAPRQITARLRYRVAGGKLLLGVVLNQPNQFLLDAVDAEVQAIIEAHPGVLTVWGKP